jgi:hypothetical protein
MNCHQILSGACNAGDRCFAVGSVEGVSFTVRKFVVVNEFSSFFLKFSSYFARENDVIEKLQCQHT